jgi:hypothetical protein
MPRLRGFDGAFMPPPRIELVHCRAADQCCDGDRRRLGSKADRSGRSVGWRFTTAAPVTLSVAAATFALVCSLIVRTEYGRTGANWDLLNVLLRIAAILIVIALAWRTIDHIIAHRNLDTINVRTHKFRRDFGASLEHEGVK